MKRCIWTILILAMATYTWGANSPSMQRILATSPKVTVNPADTATKARPFVAYTSIDGIKFRIAETDSVLELGGIETSAPEGERYIYPYNGTTPFAGTPAMGMLTTTSTGPKWYDGEAWSPIGVGYDDTALWAKFAEYMLLSAHNTYAAAVQAKFDNLSTQVSQLKTAMNAHGITLPGATDATLAPLDFGTINVNTSKTLTAQLDNTGLGNLVTTTVDKSGTGAAKYTTNGGCANKTILPGGNCIESVTFTPGATAGTYTAQLAINHNATGSPTLLNLTGIAQAVLTCSASPYIDIANTTTTTTPVANGTANVYSGLIVDAGSATHTVCKVAFYIAAIDGGVSGLSFQSEIRSTDGSKTLNGTAKAVSTAVSGSALSVGSYVVFSFPSPVAMVAGDALVITRTDHGYNTTNFIQVAYSGSSADSGYGHSARWYNTLALGSENTAQDKRIQIYEVQ